MPIPRAKQQRQTQSLPDVRDNTRYSANDFGAAVGKGLQDLGRSAGQIAQINQREEQRLEDEAEREKQRQGQARINNDLLALDKAGNDLWNNSETGYQFKERENAIDGLKSVTESLNQKQADLLSTYSDPVQREQFQLMSSRILMSHHGRYQSHAGRQSNIAERESYNGLQSSLFDDAINSYHNPTQVAHIVSTRIDVAMKRQEANGKELQSEEAKLERVLLARQAWSGVISTAINNGNPALAKQYLDRPDVKNTLDANEYGNLKAQLNKSADLKMAQSMSDLILSQPQAQDLNTLAAVEAQGIEQIRKNLSGEQEELAIRQFKTRSADRRRVLKQQKEDREHLVTSEVLDAPLGQALIQVGVIKEKDPEFGQRLEKVLQSRIQSPPETDINRQQTMHMQAEIESGKYDGLPADRAKSKIEQDAAVLGLTHGQRDRLIEAHGTQGDAVVKYNDVRSWVRRYSGDDKAELPISEWDSIRNELTDLTGGKRKATEEEVQRAVAKRHLKGYIKGNSFGIFDNDNETLQQAINSGKSDDWRPYLSDEDRTRYTQDIKTAFAAAGHEAPPITDDLIGRMIASDLSNANMNASQIIAMTLDLDSKIIQDPLFEALDDAKVQASIINGDDGKSLNAHQWAKRVRYEKDRGEELNPEWRKERQEGYPESLPEDVLKELNTNKIWWKTVVDMSDFQISNPDEYSVHIRELKSKINVDYVNALMSGMEWYNKARRTIQSDSTDVGNSLDQQIVDGMLRFIEDNARIKE